MGRACGTYRREETCIKGFGGESGPFGRRRCTQEDNIKIILQEGLK
jgi:hypothetical protein